MLGKAFSIREIKEDDRGGTALSKKKAVAQKPTKGLVLDSSIAVAWCFPDEQDAYSQSVLDALANETAIVPDLWHLEVANTLLVGERRKRSTQANTVQWMTFLASLPITVDEHTHMNAFGDIIALGRSHNSVRIRCCLSGIGDTAWAKPLATLDDKLKAAAKAVGVTLYILR